MATLRQIQRFVSVLTADRAAAQAAAPQDRTPRQQVLAGSSAVTSYLPRLTRTFTELDQVPGAYEGPGEITQQLADADATFDGTWGGIFSQVESYVRVPLVGADVKAAAGRLRKVFSSLGVTQETYVVEANIGLQVGELLPALEADLRLFPVVGGTLFDWVSHLVATAGQIEALVARRAESEAEGAVDRTAVNRLRARLMRYLKNLRTGLQDEADEAAPNSVEARSVELVFEHLTALTA